MCGIRVHVVNGVAVNIEGEPDSVTALPEAFGKGVAGR
jgi:hypothetical protein